MKKRLLIRKKRIGIFLFLVTMLAVLSGRDCYAKESKNYSDIGAYEDTQDGYSCPGIAFYMDNTIQNYAMDIWEKKENQWNYNSTRVNGQTVTESDTLKDSNGMLFQKEKDGSHRFVLSSDAGIVDGEYSVVLKRKQAGKKQEEVIEYSDDPASWEALSDYSFCNAKAANKDLALLIQNANSSSLIYRIYKAKEIAPECNGFQLDLGGGTLEESGKAYYDGEKHIIRKLPKVSKSLKGYLVTFDGWYDAKNGGNEITIGSAAYYGQTLYAHWTQRAYQYKVHYIDLLKEKEDEIEFLNHRERNVDYGKYASGADLGDSKEDGAYYKGYTLESTTKQKILKDDITVYRYFVRSKYQVHYIDQVIEGKNSGTVLRSIEKTKEYQDIANGAELGNDTGKHRYYRGYLLSDTTSARIDGKDVCVYRYFKPVRYAIHFNGMGQSGGIMHDINSCEYLEMITLPKNLYQKKIQLRLHLNCEDAICDSNESVHTAAFLGWSRTADGEVEYIDQAQVTALCDEEQEDITLYAVWDYSNQKITNVPVRTGYQFAGWSPDATAAQGNTTFQYKQDMDLYAVWKACNVPYHVEYYKEKMDGTYEKSAQYQFTGLTDNEVSIEENADIYPGFYLDRDASVLKGKVRADGSLVLAAYYSRNIYSITMDANSGKSNTDCSKLSAKKKYGTAYTIPECVATRYGYRFIGWSMEKENYHRVYQSGETILMPNHDTVLYAAWEPIEYTVHFEENMPEECKAQEQKKMADQKIGYDQVTALSECSYQAKGYQFAGWSMHKDGTAPIYQKEDKVKNLTTQEEGEVTLYAIWKPLSFWIHYEKGKTPKDMEATGEISDTQYFYNKDCFAAKSHFGIQGYHVASWNTKEDGSGITVLPGENLKGKYIAKEEVILYAIWEANEDTAFTIELRTGTQEEYEILDTKTLHGQTDSTLAKALKKCYSKTLDGEEAAFFYTGYEVTNTEALEQRIKADQSSYVILYCKKRDCKLNFLQEENGRLKTIYSIAYPYGTTVVLKDAIDDISQIERYMDDKGEVYTIGEKITLYKAVNLHIQHSVSFEGISPKTYVDRGASILLPDIKKEGYALEGWYEDTLWNDFAGKAGQRSKEIYQNKVYYPKWSEPLSYKITYDLQNTKAVILEGWRDHYVYGQKTRLPDASQVIIPDGYRFVGWFEPSDTAMTIITEIDEHQSGDKVFRLLLMREENPDKKKDEKTDTSGKLNTADTGLINTVKELRTTFNSAKELYTGNRTADTKCKQKGITYCVNDAAREMYVSKIEANKKKVIIPKTVTWKKKKYKVTKVKTKALYRHKKIQELVIPDTVTNMESKAVLQNPDLKKVTLGRNVSVIGKNNFKSCPKVERIILRGNKVKKIGSKFCQSASKIIVYGAKKQKKFHLTMLQHAGSKVKWSYRSL